MLVLNCKIKGHLYAVYADSVKIMTESDYSWDDSVILENPVVTVDGKKEDEFSQNFQGHTFDACEVAQQLIRSFINGDTTIEFMGRPAEEVMDAKKALHDPSGHTITLDNGKTRCISKNYLGQYAVLELQMINTEGCTYYTDGNECILLREDGSIATDYEFLYENSFAEDIENKNQIYLISGYIPEEYDN